MIYTPINNRPSGLRLLLIAMVFVGIGWYAYAQINKSTEPKDAPVLHISNLQGALIDSNPGKNGKNNNVSLNPGAFPNSVTTTPVEYTSYTQLLPSLIRKEYKELPFDMLGDWPYEPNDWEGIRADREKPPTAVLTLTGKKVAVTGFVIPTEYESGAIQQILLTRSQFMCCFGMPLRMNEWIRVKLPENIGKEPPMHIPVTVFGSLEISEELEDGFVMSLYRMNAEAIYIPKE